MTSFTWARYAEPGYEVSSQGDKRFSALFATLADGRTIEAHYQCDVKGFEPGGYGWKKYKGRQPTGMTRSQLWDSYLALWLSWADANPALIKALRTAATAEGGVLTDRFATSEINQAHALSIILNS